MCYCEWICPSREQQDIISLCTCKAYLLSTKQKGSSLPPMPVLKDCPSDSPDSGPAEFQHLESCPGLHLPRRPRIGALKAQRCSRSQQRGPGRADPLAQQMELRLGEKVTPTPLALPENRGKRRQPRRTSHTLARRKQQTPPTQTHTDTRAQSHTTWHDHKECERVESQDTYRHPTTP